MLITGKLHSAPPPFILVSNSVSNFEDINTPGDYSPITPHLSTGFTIVFNIDRNRQKSYDHCFTNEMGTIMNNLAENNLIRFINITKKKDGIFANFKVSGIKGGMVYKATISVDLDAADVDLGDPMETIIEACAKIAVSEFKKSELQFEGLAAV